MKRIFIIVIFLLIVGAIGVTLIPTDRNRIKKVIDSCKTAVLKHDISGFMEKVSFNYSDDSGNSYLLLKKKLEKLLNRFSDFEITADVIRMNIVENSAEAHVNVSVIASEGDERGYLVGDAGGVQDVKVYFEKTPSLHWKIIRTEQVYQSRMNSD